MGSCYSTTYSSSAYTNDPTAKVIALDGSLREYPVPTTVSDVLRSNHTSCFLCSSDQIFLDAHIRPLGSTDLLQPDQIYFVLPNAKLKYPLTSTDMLALAAKASSAIADASNKCGRGREIRVSPVEEVNDEGVNEEGRVGVASRSSSGQSHSNSKRLTAIEEVADE